MTKARRHTCLLCGDGYVPSRSLTAQEVGSLLSTNDTQMYCASCGPRQYATLEEKGHLRRLHRELLREHWEGSPGQDRDTIWRRDVASTLGRTVRRS